MAKAHDTKGHDVRDESYVWTLSVPKLTPNPARTTIFYAVPMRLDEERGHESMPRYVNTRGLTICSPARATWPSWRQWKLAIAVRPGVSIKHGAVLIQAQTYRG